MTSSPKNSFYTFKPEPDPSVKLINKRDFIHNLFADYLSYLFTGYKLSDVNSETTPTSDSLSYKSLAKGGKYAKFNYGSPDKSAEKDNSIPRYFNETPIVRLIRGPNRINTNDSNKNTGLAYFEVAGIVPTLTILNNHFESMDMKIYDRPHKNGGSLWLVFENSTFEMPERKPFTGKFKKYEEDTTAGAEDTTAGADEEYNDEPEDTTE